jgi:hypothetical protein
MKVPDPRLNFIMSTLRSIGKARVGELAGVCVETLDAIARPAATKISINLSGLDPEDISSGQERKLAGLDKALDDYGLTKAENKARMPGFVSISLDDGNAITIGVVKHLGNYVGYVAAYGDDMGPEGITLAEAVWLCSSQLSLRIHTLLSPNSPMAVEILGRRILRALGDGGIKTLTIGPAAGREPWISLNRASGKIFAKEIERLPQEQVAAINSGEIIGENTLKYLWSEFEVALGIWISSEAGYYLAIGFEDRKIPGPQLIAKIRNQIESAARNDYEYLIKSFEKLRTEFDKLVKSERAAAVTETTVTINHEINNPLTAILGNTQLLLMSKDKLPPDIVSKLQTIERSAVKIRETTAKLMSIIEPVTAPYVSGLEMIDIEKSKKKKTQ